MNQFERLQLVILSHNRLDCLPRLFNELLLPAAGRGVHVTVVDNASVSEIHKFFAQYNGIENLEIIFINDNVGVAKGRNRGFINSNREYIVCLDDDSIIQPEELALVPVLFDEQPEAGILAFRVVHGITNEPQNEHLFKVQVGNFHGAGHAIRRSLFRKVGFLDERYFFGAEELEFTMRALVAGMLTVYAPEIVVKHFSLIRIRQNILHRRLYWARNYTMTLFRYLPFVTASLFSFRLLFSYVVSGAKTMKIGVVLLPLAMLGGSLMGLCSRNPLDAAGVAFYVNPETKPELGNVSICRKIFKKLRRNNIGLIS